MKRSLFVFMFFLGAINARCQSFDWWAQSVNWDGVSPWPRYMITLPAFQGPNSLPVPAPGNGSIDSSFSLALTGNFHFSKGDNTQNLKLYANYCLVKDVISFDATWIPYEHYRMTHEEKTRRHVFIQFYNDEHVSGDLYLNTNIRLLKKWRPYIDLALRIGYRFPSGGGFGAARYSDGPGYHFDFSFGKRLAGTHWKWTGMAGFYTWQIVSDRHRQDDAFLFGTGLEWNRGRFRLQNYVAGYLGYMLNSGDKPIIIRSNLERKGKRSSLVLGLQQGLHDFRYSSAELGMKYYFR